MLRLYSVVIFLWIMHLLVIGVELTIEKNKVYYKAEGAVVTNQTDLKNVIPIVIEGQPPLSELTTRKITEKISTAKSQIGTAVKSNDKLHRSSERTMEESVINSNKVENLTDSSNSTKNIDRFHIVPVSEITQIEGADSFSKTTKRTKPKPIVTIGEKEVDKPIPVSPTNKSSFGSPRKIDYIVPGVITVTALPLLAIIFYVLYKRGRDYWEKRHYRRMDFLIDGMYNE